MRLSSFTTTNKVIATTMTVNPNERPPVPPFTSETAVQKVRMAEDAWNSRDPAKISLAYTVDSIWRNRSDRYGRFPKIKAVNSFNRNIRSNEL